MRRVLLTTVTAAIAAVLSVPAAGTRLLGPEEPFREVTYEQRNIAASLEAVSRLEGTLRTGPISQRQAEATLRRYGLTKWIGRFRPLSPLAETTRLILVINHGEWNLYGKSGDGPRESIDYNAEYVVNGNKMDKIHATGVTTFRWSVNGDRLTLVWLRTTEPPYEGIPDEVFQRALYMTRDFKRQR
jgi:hypothetical protein